MAEAVLAPGPQERHDLDADGDLWSRQRRMMQPAFQGSAIRAFAPLIQDVNAALVERWASHARTGEAINLTQELSAVALDIVLRALFSADLDRLIRIEGKSPFDLLAEDSQRDLRFAAVHWRRSCAASSLRAGRRAARSRTGCP